MKKILSFMLVLSMLFSMVSFAAPVAEVVESATEVADIVETTPVSEDAAALSTDGYITIFEEDFQDHTETQTVVEIGTTAQVKPYWATNTQGYSNRPHIWGGGGTSASAGAMSTNSNMTLITGTDGNKYYQVNSYNSKYWFLYVNFGPYNAMSKAGDYILTFDVIQSRNSGFNNIAFGGSSVPAVPSTLTSSLTPVQNTAAPYVHRATISWSVDGTSNGGSGNEYRRQFQCQGTMGGSEPYTAYGFDNFKLEYRAPKVAATVSFDANGVDATVPATINTYVGETVELPDATTEDETKLFKGWATSADGEVITSPLTVSDAAYTLYAVWETIQVGVTYPASGVIFFEDFEDFTVGATEFYLAEAGALEGFVADAYKNDRPKASNVGGSWWEQGVASSGFTLVQESGNKFMKKTESLAWQYFGVSFYHGGGYGIITPGTYTLSYDVICDGRAISNAAYNNNSYPYMASGSPDYLSYSTTANGMTPNGRKVTVTMTIEPGDNDETITKHAARLVEQFNAGGTGITSTYVGVDNIKLEYVAPPVATTVTFDANGVEGATLPNAYTGLTNTAIDLSTYTATAEGKVFMGWATEANGEVVSTFTPSAPAHTLYAIWEDAVTESTVTFVANGITATVPDAVVVTIGDTLDLSDYVATTTASYEFLGWATTEDGEVVSTFAPTVAEHTLYAQWKKIIADGYVVDMDFEGSTVGDVLLTSSGAVAWKGAHNKALAKYREVIGSTSAQNGFSGSWLGGDATVAQLTDGNKVMQVVNSASKNSGWNRLAIRTPDFSLEGKYTVSFNYMVPTGSAVDRILFYNSDYTTNFSGTTVTKMVGSDIKNDVWYTYSVTLDVSSTNKLSAVKLQPKSTADGGIFYLDDIKYYYESPKAPSVVTFATTNGAIEVPAAATSGIGGRLDLSLYIPTINDSTLKFKGWSTTTDETGLITSGVFTPTEAAHTLYAITEAAALVHPYFSTDFNAGDKVIFADGKAEVGGVVQYYKTHTVVDGVLRTTFTDADTDETTGKGTWIPDPIQTHKYVTADTPLVKADIKGLAVAYKFNDTVYNGDWTDNTLGLNKDYNKADMFFGAAGAADSELKNVGNVWQYNNRNAMVYYDFANSANWTANWASVADEIGIVRFDLLQGAYDGMSYDLDYVKFVLADDRIIPVIPAEKVHTFAEKTVTFTYPEGINADDAAALTAADFGKYAKSFVVEGNTITVTVGSAYVWGGSNVVITSPGIKNADGDMTYVTTYYNMTFETLGAPTTIDAAQIRTDGDATTQGMRYAAYIETAAEACEYGFIVTRESFLQKADGTYAYNAFVMDDNVTRTGTQLSGKNSLGLTIVGAVAITGDGAKTIYSTTGEEFGDYAIDDGLYFTTVLTNIPLTVAGVNTRFVGRPYVKLTDGTYVHGAPITRALADIANEVIANTEGGMVNCDMYIKNIYMASMGMFG